MPQFNYLFDYARGLRLIFSVDGFLNSSFSPKIQFVASSNSHTPNKERLSLNPSQTGYHQRSCYFFSYVIIKLFILRSSAREIHTGEISTNLTLLKHSERFATLSCLPTLWEFRLTKMLDQHSDI